jgi:cellobiose-specific phosphotransferase system component IIA
MKRFKEFNEQIAMSVGGGAIAGMPTASPPEQTPVGAGITTSKRKNSSIITSLLRRKKLSEGYLISEAKEGAYSDEHAHARIWNHMTDLGIAHDKEAMQKEYSKAKTNKKHPLHFDNAKDHEGFVGGKKTKAHQAAYHAEHENAIHTIHGLATHPDFKKAVKEKHKAQVTGGARGELSDTWKKYGATKGATSKTDIAIMKPNSKNGEGIRLSMKKGAGSQLMSAGPEETNAVHHVAAKEMLDSHPKYAKLSQKKKDEIHSDIMSKVKQAGKHLDAMRTAKESDLQGLKQKAQKALDSVHDAHPALNHFVRKEATTGRGKFGEKSAHAASYIVKSAAGKKGVSVQDVNKMNFEGPRPRAALPKGETSAGRRSGNVKLDER